MPAARASVRRPSGGRARQCCVLVALLALAGCERAAGPVDPAKGERTFAARCASCHAIGPAARHGFGPQLSGLYGRAAGKSPGYAYSTAMRRSGIVWSDTTLRAFLADPQAVVPETKMRFWGLRDERTLSDLLAYLRGAGAAPGPGQP